MCFGNLSMNRIVGANGCSNRKKAIISMRLSEERKLWLVRTSCRYIWQKPEAIVARNQLYENLNRNGYESEDIVLMRIEHDMDKYFNAFNLVNLNDYLL